MSSNVSWATAKTGIGDTTESSNFFIGLENLHNLLSQADYFATVYCHFDSNPSEGRLTYESFVVGPESSSYALSYESVNSAQTEFLDNVFNDSALLFSTFDHDPNSCEKGYPGWFGSDCSESPPFADSVVWPVNGEPKNVDYLFIQVFRSSNFNVNWCYYQLFVYPSYQHFGDMLSCHRDLICFQTKKEVFDYLISRENPENYSDFCTMLDIILTDTPFCRHILYTAWRIYKLSILWSS